MDFEAFPSVNQHICLDKNRKLLNTVLLSLVVLGLIRRYSGKFIIARITLLEEKNELL